MSTCAALSSGARSLRASPAPCVKRAGARRGSPATTCRAAPAPSPRRRAPRRVRDGRRDRPRVILAPARAENLEGVAGDAASNAADAAAAQAAQAARAAADASAAVGDALGGVAGGAASVAPSAADASRAAASQAADALGAANAAASSLVGALEGAVPPEFADVVRAAESDSDAAAALAAAVVAVPVALNLAAPAARGYAGDKNAFVVDEALSKDRNAFLVDTRDERARRDDGVPDLRGSQRGKGAAIEIARVEERTRRALADPRAVELELAAMKVRALTRGGARVYVMGPDAAALARAVTKLGGRKAFVLSGGYEAWRSAGLKVRSNGRYEKSALDALGEESSAAAGRLTQKVSAAAGTAKTQLVEGGPATIARVAGGVALAAAAAYNYETALQYAGVIGLELTLLSKVLSYENPMELFNDVKDAVVGAAEAASEFEMPAKVTTVEKVATETKPRGGARGARGARGAGGARGARGAHARGGEGGIRARGGEGRIRARGGEGGPRARGEGRVRAASGDEPRGEEGHVMRAEFARERRKEEL